MPCTYVAESAKLGAAVVVDDDENDDDDPGGAGAGVVSVAGACTVTGPSTSSSPSFSSTISGGALIRSSIARFWDSDRVCLFGGFGFLASCILHATAFNSRIRLASVTRRLKRGSVARVRNVSLRILVYAGDRPRWMRERYSSVGSGGISRRTSHR